MKKIELALCEVVSAYVCDRCGREAKIDNPETNEFISIEFVGGYDSVFGDGAQISIDICQHCLKETLGAWIKSSYN